MDGHDSVMPQRFSRPESSASDSPLSSASVGNRNCCGGLFQSSVGDWSFLPLSRFARWAGPPRRVVRLDRANPKPLEYLDRFFGCEVKGIPPADPACNL